MAMAYCDFTFRLQSTANFKHFVPCGGRFGDQVGVVEETKVLGGVRHTVELAVGVGESLQGRLDKFVCLVAQVDRGYQTALDQSAQPVMDADVNVGAFTGRHWR